MGNKLQENQGVAVGMVTSVILTAALTGQSKDRAMTFLSTLGSCAIGVGVTWLFVRGADRARRCPTVPIPEDEQP